MPKVAFLLCFKYYYFVNNNIDTNYLFKEFDFLFYLEEDSLYFSNNCPMFTLPTAHILKNLPSFP